jgi:hypothetical protein
VVFGPLMVWPTSPGAMACSWRVSCPLDAPAGPEASSIHSAASIGTTVGLTNVDLWLQLPMHAHPLCESAILWEWGPACR